MASGQLSLQQEDFGSKYVGSFENLRDAGELLDVTLACDDETVDAHKLLLSACSPFFRHIFARIKQSQPFIYLKGVHHEDLKALVDYIYKGEAKVSAENLKRFFKTAEELKIKGLTENEIFGKVDEIQPPEKRSRKEVDDMSLFEKFGEGGLSLWKCNACDKLYNNEEEMKAHVKDVHAKTEDSPFRDETKVSIFDHIKDIQSETKNDLSITNESINLNAAVPVKNEFPYTYEELHGSKPKTESSSWHTEMANSLRELRDPKKRKLWECTHCGKTSKSKFKLERHVETHLKRFKLFSYTCKYCGKQPKTRDALTSHIHIKHREEKMKESNMELPTANEKDANAESLEEVEEVDVLDSGATNEWKKSCQSQTPTRVT